MVNFNEQRTITPESMCALDTCLVINYHESMIMLVIIQKYVIHSRDISCKNACHYTKIKVRKRAKIGNRYNQAPQLTQDTNEC